MATIVQPASGGTAGVLPRDRSIIEDWVSERRVAPWPPEWSPWGRGDLSSRDVTGGDLYRRYSADVKATGERPLSHVDFGVALQTIPGLSRHRESAGILWSGLTIETRAERVHAKVHDKLYRDAMDARSGEPWHQRYEAHRLKHIYSFIGGHAGDFDCTHDQPPDVLAGLAEVEAAIAPDVAAGMKRYRAYATPVGAPEPTAPDPFAGLAASDDGDPFTDY